MGLYWLISSHIITYYQIHFPNHTRALTEMRLGHSLICKVWLSKVPSKFTTVRLPGCDFCGNPQPVPSPMKWICIKYAWQTPPQWRNDWTKKKGENQTRFSEMSFCGPKQKSFIYLSHADWKPWNTAREINIHTSLCLPSTVSLPLSQQPPQPKAHCRELDKPLEAQ